MTSYDDLRPSAEVPGLALERIGADSPVVRTVQARIGEPYGWLSATRSDQEWTAWLAHPTREYWLITYDGETAGIADIEPGPDGEVEITTFGLLPEFVGRGLGGYALTLAVRRAWTAGPEGHGPVRRVWLHTSTLDHPNAIGNYRRRGFRPYRTETRGQAVRAAREPRQPL